MKASESFYKKWYGDVSLSYLIPTITKNREVMTISKRYGFRHRMIKIHSRQHFDFWIRLLSESYYGSHPFRNIYYSMMKYKNGIPSLKPYLRKREDIMPEYWIKQHFYTAISYDFLLDFDMDSDKDFEQVKKEVLITHNNLVLCGCEHKINFTGNGFHIIIPYNALNVDIDLTKDFGLLSEFLQLIQEQMMKKCPSLDVGVGSDARRVSKIPFSLSIYEDLTCRVVVPFFDTKDLNDFKIDDSEPYRWIQLSLREKYFFQNYLSNCVFCKGGKINTFIDEVKKW